MAKPPTTIDEYLTSLPDDSRELISTIRRMIRDAAPQAIEGIKYGMPTAALGGSNLIHYAAWKRHIGLYPIYSGDADFEETVGPYRDKKDTVRFPLNQPLPLKVIDAILAARLERCNPDSPVVPQPSSVLDG